MKKEIIQQKKKKLSSFDEQKREVNCFQNFKRQKNLNV